MKYIGSILLTFGLVILTSVIALDIMALNEYSRKIYGEWELADRSSTIPKKAEHVSRFYSSLSGVGFEGEYDALILKKPENDCDANLEALGSLKDRLESTKTLDENSFAYQSAIQQITAQEQGEATSMLATLRGCWFKIQHPVLWFDAYIVLGSFLLLVGGGLLIIWDDSL